MYIEYILRIRVCVKILSNPQQIIFKKYGGLKSLADKWIHITDCILL